MKARQIVEGIGTLTDGILRQKMRATRRQEIPEGAVPIMIAPDGSVYIAHIDDSFFICPEKKVDYSDYDDNLGHS